MKKYLILLGLAMIFAWSGCKKDEPRTGNGGLTCKITSPANGVELPLDEDITVTVEAKSTTGTIEMVTVYLDSLACNVAEVEPYTLTIISEFLTIGTHTIKAVATTTEGKQAEASITVTIIDTGGGDENESPNFVTFADGEIPPSWKTNTWVVDVAMGYDDNYSLRADNPVSSVFTQKTMSTAGYVEFHIRGEDYFDLYIDGNKAQAFSSVSLGNNWKKWVYTFEKGKHSFRWENTNGSIIHLDAITFAKAKLPKVTTNAVTNITATSATSGGNVTDNGNSPVTARGVCWSTSENPTIADNKTTNGTGTGSFTSDISGLDKETVYYVRAYATNSIGTAYGEQMNFTTKYLYLPTVTTANITSITTSSAQCGGDVTNEGFGSVTARGVCWSTSENPTIDDKKTTNGSGTGSFTSNITGLNQGTLYYVRAYATNEAGTAYGEQKNFSSSKYKVGEYAEGGIIVYVDETGQHGFVATTKYQATGIQWSSKWIETGADGEEIGTGKSNTAKIVQAQGEGNYAAKICDCLILNGYDDWYLPSSYELATVLNIIGWSESGVWTSTEDDYRRAYLLECDSWGGNHWYIVEKNLTYDHKVRCIRDF
ncbi:MAG: hypothetical protein LBU83_13815 [Bacteroidales bacterium]|nr:hypothetical protein [Bacteroidales bacterium]